MEIWKNIDGFDGTYQISNYGRVLSYKQNRPRIMKTQDDGHGYQRVRLRNNNNYEYHYIHRLVAKAFVSNENNYNTVNHKDENKNNNYYKNLEWCDNQYNLNYGTSRQRAIKNTCKKILQYNFDGHLIKEWGSIISASKELKIDNSCITKCCKGKVKTAGSYIWKYKLD